MFRRKKKKNKIDISIIIPFHNVEKYIRECLESVIDQKGIISEIILINDGSTDKTESIVDEYVGKYKNFRLLKIQNRGPGYARNYGVRHASGDFIAFVDADDIVVKGIYRRMIRAARNNKAELCICNAARFNEKAIWKSDLHQIVYKNYKLSTHITETPSLIYDSCVWNKIIKRDYYVKNKIEFPEGIVYEDIITSFKIHFFCNKTVMLAETGYLWRVRENKDNPSITQKYYSQKNIDDRFLISKQMLSFLDKMRTSLALQNAVRKKLLEIDIRIIMDSVQYITQEQGKDVFERINQFIIDNNLKKDISSLSIIDRQRYQYVFNKDIDSYLELLKYKRNSYDREKIYEKEGDLLIEITDEIINVDKRIVTDEFSLMERRTWIDGIKVDEDSFLIDSHIYIHRYNMARPGDQALRIILLNEETSRIISVPYEDKETSFLTKNYGEAYVEDSKTKYNYDYTGFSFRIGKNILDGDYKYKKTKYSVIIEYSDRLFEGNQILKGVNEEIIKRYERLRLNIGEYRIRLKFGVQKELQIIVDKIDQ